MKKDYTFSNQANYNQRKNNRKGIASPARKQIFCITNATLYDSITIASKLTGVAPYSISKIIKGSLHHSKGYEFKEVLQKNQS